MKLLQFNSKSLNTSQDYLQDYIKYKEFDILCITEIWDPTKIRCFKEYVSILDSREEKQGGGAAIFRHKSIKMVKNDNLMDNFELEAAWAETCINNQRCIIGSVYIPPGEIDKLDILDRALESIPISTPLLITGDLNCRSLSWERHRDNSKSTQSWKMGEKLEKIALKHGLLILNNGAYTRQESGNWSTPDLTLQRGLKKTPKWWTDSNVFLSSDHFPMRKADNTKWEEKTLTELKQLIDDNFCSNNSPDKAAEVLTDCLMKCAEECLPKKNVCCYSKPFWNQEITEASKKVKRAKNRAQSKGDPASWKVYKECQVELNKVYELSKERYWADKVSLLKAGDTAVWPVVNKLVKGSCSSAVQPLYDRNNKLCFDDKDISNILAETHIIRTSNEDQFDQTHYIEIEKEVECIIKNEKENLNDKSPYNSDLTEQEVAEARKAVPAFSSPGPDKVIPWMIKKANSVIVTVLRLLFLACWTVGQVPSIWKKTTKSSSRKKTKMITIKLRHTEE